MNLVDCLGFLKDLLGFIQEEVSIPYSLIFPVKKLLSISPVVPFLQIISPRV
jgi:hypothetical protein